MNAPDEQRPRLQIVSDTICPWCYIGKRRLDAALALLDDGIAFEVHWRPFELNPEMPIGGIDRRTYRIRKFGSWEHSLVLDAQVREAGAADGLVFHHDRMLRTPNTLASHALIQLAQPFGLQHALVEAIFKAYFTDGLDVGDHDTLLAIATACDLPREDVESSLSDQALIGGIRQEATAYRQAGVTGVPTVILNRHILFSGAQPPATMAAILERALSNAAVMDETAGATDSGIGTEPTRD